MKHRYKYAATAINSSGNRVFRTILYPMIPRTTDDIYIRSNAGDKLDEYAVKYYGDSRYWPIIAIANQIGKGSIIVPAGMQIRIPSKNIDFDTLISTINK